ncbi:hypothetical protein [Halomonas kalidii]|uniref:CidA/LrgA family protein n=1 Tax=Halomonas kalidii TaxID=3043293 RepID=A0ABT6VMN5_9GAMM|nr:hypothetical protein [Halomonas kalidii]MDI5934026.1 hypothetical protein [Halomonas kalidii]
MSLLWLSYGFLSLVVVLTGYLGLGFLPRLPRLVTTWLVAGMIWVPARFRLPLLEEGEFYTGFAPAVMVAAVAFLERNASVMVPALLLLVAGGLAGAGVGLLLWWRGLDHHEYVDMDEDDEPMPPRRGGGGERREPMIG